MRPVDGTGNFTTICLHTYIMTSIVHISLGELNFGDQNNSIHKYIYDWTCDVRGSAERSGRSGGSSQVIGTQTDRIGHVLTCCGHPWRWAVICWCDILILGERGFTTLFLKVPVSKQKWNSRGAAYSLGRRSLQLPIVLHPPVDLLMSAMDTLGWGSLVRAVSENVLSVPNILWKKPSRTDW